MERYSKKRQAVLDCLRSTDSHPSAEWIYNRLKPLYPNLSLATVYRNLIHLKHSGAIRSVGVIDGQERFDGNISPHPHAVCSKCGKIIDIMGINIPDTMKEEAESKTDFIVSGVSVSFSGFCCECAKKTDNMTR